MARSKSSRRWLREHFDDHWVQRAQQEGWRSRSAFKLIELDQRDHLLRPGMAVVDLGAAPGGWSQVARDRVGSGGRVLALDILPLEPLEGVEVITGDFTEDEPLAALERALDGRPVQLVMSDMAPNMSGIAVSDQARAMYLAELALAFATEHLEPGGDLVVKVFQGAGFDDFVRQCREAFARVHIRKPEASRPRSREVYVVARSHES